MLSESIVLQLIVVGVLATLLFFIAYSLPQKIAATGLILLIPFQPVDTRMGTANVILTFVVFLAMLMRERNVRLPMLPHILILLFVFLISMGLADPETWRSHAFYIFYLISAVLVFWITYDLAHRVRSVDQMMNIFVAMNACIIAYCLFQLWIGPDEEFRFFGMQEFSINHLRADKRLTGPFGSAGLMAEYFVIATYMNLHLVLTTPRQGYRRFLILLIAFNLLLLVATGNRGGFLTLLGAGVLFLWMFRHLLGAGRTLMVAIVGTLLLAISSAIAINYTDFGTLYDRLSETELEEGIPDTRVVVWPMAWNEIKKRPVFGHGPRLQVLGDELAAPVIGETLIYYPHNLYLFLMYTVGITGLAAFLILLSVPLYRCSKARRRIMNDPKLQSFASIAIIVMVIIFVDQIKVEFLRFRLVDYWHFIFAWLGLLVAFCDMVMTNGQDEAGETFHGSRPSLQARH